MNLFQLVKHDIISILRSPLTYLAFVLTLLPIIGMTALVNQQMKKVDGDVILAMGSWFFSIVGLSLIHI